MEQEKLARNVIITKSSIKKLLGCDNSYAYTMLNRLMKKGVVRKIIKSKYTSSKNVYLIATNLFFPCYLSFWSCAYFKGYTEQIVNTIQVTTTTRHRKIKFEGYSIEFHKMDRKYFFGYEKIKYGENSTITLADDEKLLIDCIHKENLLGNIDEIIKVIKSSQINKEKIVNYLKRINNKSLMKRVGFLLERFKGIDISGILPFKDKNYVNLSIYLKNDKKNSKWQVKHSL